MKEFLLGFLKKLAKAIAVLSVLIVVYLFFLSRDIKKIDDFCNEMQPGLDVNEIHRIADKYDVGSQYVRDPNAIKNGSLGFKPQDKENTWFFAVAAPMTIGEHACGVYHNNKVVLSASKQPKTPPWLSW
jgi:hypothetical protein